MAGSLIFALGIVVQQAGMEGSDSTAESLQLFHDNSGRLIAGSLMQAFAFLLFLVPLYVLFKSAAGRAEGVRGFLLPLVLMGPPLFLVGTLILGLATKNVANDYVQQVPAKEREAREKATAAQ